MKQMYALTWCVTIVCCWCAAYVADHWKHIFCKIRAHLHCGYHQITCHALFRSSHRTRSTTSITSHYQSVQNITALSTAPDQVYTSHRAVPTSQITQNIENINRRNIADMSQLNTLTRSDHVLHGHGPCPWSRLYPRSHCIEMHRLHCSIISESFPSLCNMF